MENDDRCATGNEEYGAVKRSLNVANRQVLSGSCL